MDSIKKNYININNNNSNNKNKILMNNISYVNNCNNKLNDITIDKFKKMLANHFC